MIENVYTFHVPSRRIFGRNEKNEETVNTIVGYSMFADGRNLPGEEGPWEPLGENPLERNSFGPGIIKTMDAKGWCVRALTNVKPNIKPDEVEMIKELSWAQLQKDFSIEKAQAIVEKHKGTGGDTGDDVIRAAFEVFRKK